MDRAPLSTGLFALSRGTFLLSLTVKPLPYRWIFLVPIAIIDTYLIFFTTTGNATLNNGIAIVIIAYFFMASDYILLTDVQRELHLQGDRASVSDRSLRSRFIWAVKLLFSPRGVGWAHERSSVLPPPPKTSRKVFIISQLLWGIIYILRLDIAQIHHAWHPSYAVNGAPFPRPSLTSAWWLLNFAGFAFDAVTHITLLCWLPSIVLIALGETEPSAWPPVFGKWSDAYTLRRFWGRTWHQFLRRMISSHGRYFAQKVLHAPRGSLASSYSQLYIGFLISALFHYGIDYMILGHWGGGGMIFFMSQAVAITFEDAVIAFARRLGFKGSSWWQRLFGYVWVWVWFAYSTPVWIGPTLRSGLVAHEMHFSVIMGLWRGVWFPKA